MCKSFGLSTAWKCSENLRENVTRWPCKLAKSSVRKGMLVFLSRGLNFILMWSRGENSCTCVIRLSYKVISSVQKTFSIKNLRKARVKIRIISRIYCPFIQPFVLVFASQVFTFIYIQSEDRNFCTHLISYIKIIKNLYSLEYLPYSKRVQPSSVPRPLPDSDSRTNIACFCRFHRNAGKLWYIPTRRSQLDRTSFPPLAPSYYSPPLLSLLCDIFCICTPCFRIVAGTGTYRNKHRCNYYGNPGRNNSTTCIACIRMPENKQSGGTNRALIWWSFPSWRCPTLFSHLFPQLRHLMGQVKYWFGNKIFVEHSDLPENFSFSVLSALNTSCAFRAERYRVLFSSVSIANRSCL